MAAPARRLSNRLLFKALDIPSDVDEFISVHKGDEANLMALFDNIAALKETSPEDWTRINAVAMNVENPDDIVEAIAREIFPPVKQGVRGKDPSTPAAVEQRAGAATDTQDSAALAEVPPETPAPPAQETAPPAAKKTRGRPKNQPAAETPPVVPPAMPPAGVTPGDTAVIAGGAVPAATGTGDVSAFTDTVSPRGESPLRQFNPFEGIDFSQFQQGMPSQAAPQMPDMQPQPMPATPDADMSIDDMIAAMDALDYQGGAARQPTPLDLSGLTQDMSMEDLQSLLEAQQGNYDPNPPAPLGGSGQGPYPGMGPSLPSSGVEVRSSPLQTDTPPDTGTSGGGAPPPSPTPTPTPSRFSPFTDTTRNFMKARNLEGLNTGVLTKPVDHLIRNSPFYAAAGLGAAGLSAYNRAAPPQGIAPPTADEVAADEENYRMSLEALKQIRGTSKPIAIPNR